MLDAYIYDGLRSPVGRYGGILAGVRPDDLAAQVVRALVARSPFPVASIEDVVLGNTIQASEASRNLARFVALLSDLPTDTAGETINRLCGSGLAALVSAARAITCGEGDLFIAGGVESMTRAPFVIPKAESAFSRAAIIADTTLGVTFPHPRIVTSFGNESMAETADNVARELGISREQGDAFALQSQARYASAKQAGFFVEEIVPIAMATRGLVDAIEDEHPRPQTDAASLSKLRATSATSVVTAGNAAGINDGAAALILGSREIGARHGVKPLGRIVAAATAGVPPRVMGLGPVPAIRKVLERTGLDLAQMDVIEINEAFAAQVLGCLQQLGLSPTDARLNPNGGAIAIGHPLGCTGARLALTALRQLEWTGGRYALVSLCIGIGNGIAAIIERVS